MCVLLVPLFLCGVLLVICVCLLHGLWLWRPICLCILANQLFSLSPSEHTLWLWRLWTGTTKRSPTAVSNDSQHLEHTNLHYCAFSSVPTISVSWACSHLQVTHKSQIWHLTFHCMRNTPGYKTGKTFFVERHTRCILTDKVPQASVEGLTH